MAEQLSDVEGFSEAVPQLLMSKHALVVILSKHFCQPKHCQLSWHARAVGMIKRIRRIAAKGK
jgi:hypothetical protein